MGILSNMLRMAIVMAATAVGGPIAGGVAAGVTKQSGSGASGRLLSGLGAGLGAALKGGGGGGDAPVPGVGASLDASGGASFADPSSLASGPVGQGALQGGLGNLGSFISPEITDMVAGDPLGSMALNNLMQKIPGGGLLKGGVFDKDKRFF